MLKKNNNKQEQPKNLDVITRQETIANIYSLCYSHPDFPID